MCARSGDTLRRGNDGARHPFRRKNGKPFAREIWKGNSMTLLLNTDNDSGRLLMRVVLGGVIFAHGAQKLLGWFGGPGYSATMEHFTTGMGIPAALAFLAIMAESVGSLALVVGFLTRIAAAGISVVMLVAVATVHWQNGFFMNWSGNQAGEGFEYHLLALAIAVPLMIKGGGMLSIDGTWARRRRAKSYPSGYVGAEPVSVNAKPSASGDSVGNR